MGVFRTRRPTRHTLRQSIAASPREYDMPQPYRPKGSKQREKEAAYVPPERAELSALASPQPKFDQALGSNDKEVREKAVKALQAYLKRARDIEELELRKIWKALFYCFWHSDKRKVQEELAERLAGFVHSMASAEKAWLFVKVFWSTMSREWTGIDRLRMDKFYSLLRRSVEHTLKMVAQAGWAHDATTQLAETLGDEGGPLHPKAPIGIRYFMCDYFMPSLQETVQRSSGLDGAGMLAVLEPFLVLCGQAEDDVTLRKLMEGVVQPVLLGGIKAGGGEEEDEDEDEDEEEEENGGGKAAGSIKLPQPLDALSERLFDLASDKSTKERNRRLLYALQQRVERLAATDEGKAASAEASAAREGSGGKKASKADKADKAGKAGKAGKAKAAEASASQLDGLRNLLGKAKTKKRSIDVIEIGRPAQSGKGDRGGSGEDEDDEETEDAKEPKKKAKKAEEGKKAEAQKGKYVDEAAAEQAVASKKASKAADVATADKIARMRRPSLKEKPKLPRPRQLQRRQRTARQRTRQRSSQTSRPPKSLAARRRASSSKRALRGSATTGTCRQSRWSFEARVGAAAAAAAESAGDRTATMPASRTVRGCFTRVDCRCGPSLSCGILHREG